MDGDLLGRDVSLFEACDRQRDPKTTFDSRSSTMNHAVLSRMAEWTEE